LRSPSTELPYPSILRLKRYVNVPRRGAVWSRRAVFARDSYRCVYCNTQLDRETATVDHLIPREICSREGIKASTFSNCVTACASCNKRKRNLRIEDSGLKFYDKNYIPRAPRTNYMILSGNVPSDWKAYLNI
jgi:5-methylcytosine-specific restriction endonuclease McrA